MLIISRLRDMSYEAVIDRKSCSKLRKSNFNNSNRILEANSFFFLLAGVYYPDSVVLN